MWLSRPERSAWWIPSASGVSEGCPTWIFISLQTWRSWRLEVLPLAHPQVVEELAPAHPPERAAELALLLLQVAPEVEPGEEVGGLVLEPRVLLVGLRALLRRALAGVLDRQRRGDHEHLAHAAEPLGLQDHPAQAWVDRQPGEPPADLGEPLVGGEGAELLEQCHAVGDGCGGRAARRRGTRRRRRGPSAVICRMTEARLVRRISGSVNSGARVEVLLGVEPDRRCRRRTRPQRPARWSAEACEIGSIGSRCTLRRAAVARDARAPGVDDVADAGHGQRGLGDVGGEHDPAPGVRLEDAVLLGGREARVERQDLGAAAAVPAQGVGGVADLPLAGEEDEDVARRPSATSSSTASRSPASGRLARRRRRSGTSTSGR